MRLFDWSRRRSPNHPANLDYARWKQIRLEVLKRDHYTCQTCGAVGGRLAVDHIIATRDGGDPWGAGNLEVLCDGAYSCHKAKTAKENSSSISATTMAFERFTFQRTNVILKQANYLP